MLSQLSLLDNLEENELIENIVNICANLVLNKKIKNKQLYKKITEKIKESVKDLEPIRVLYNNTYGSLSIGKEYIKYCNEIKNMNITDRYQVGRGEVTINNITDFGKYMAEKNPEEFKLISNKIDYEDDHCTGSSATDLYLKYGLKKASHHCSNLKVKKIPPFLDYYIYEYDGLESVILY
jgi:hypothetical protein